MNWQLIIIVLLFAAALAYLGRMVYQSFQAKKSCEGDCKCESSPATKKLLIRKS